MGLLTQVEADLGSTLEAAGDYGSTVQLAAPTAGVASYVPMQCQRRDIGAYVDPETGSLVVGRHLAYVFRLSSLVTAGFAANQIPQGQQDTDESPWLIQDTTVNGETPLLAVTHSVIDYTIGHVVCLVAVVTTGA